MCFTHSTRALSTTLLNKVQFTMKLGQEEYLKPMGMAMGLKKGFNSNKVRL